MRLLGIDPGLQKTGWGVIDVYGSRLLYVADGVIYSNSELSLADRLCQLFDGMTAVVDQYKPEEAAIEQVFVNRNPVSTLKLGQARGAVMLAPAKFGIQVFEYLPNEIKKTVTGTGHAAKQQIGMMVKILLSGVSPKQEDSADALAVAICHAHSSSARLQKIEKALAKEKR